MLFDIQPWRQNVFFSFGGLDQNHGWDVWPAHVWSQSWKTRKHDLIHMLRSEAASSMAAHLTVRTLTESKWNVHVHLDRSRYIRSLTHPHKQTIKVNHFLLTSKLKLSIPRGAVLLDGCVLMTASSQGYEMQTRPGGHYCLPSNHYQLFSRINHSFHSLGLFIFTVFLLVY